MNAATVTTAPPTALRERLAFLLNAMAEGIWRGDDCANCGGIFAGPADRCPECAQTSDDGEKLDAGIAAVQEALTEPGAIAAWFDCLAAVAGLSVAVEAVAVECGTGGAR